MFSCERILAWLALQTNVSLIDAAYANVLRDANRSL